MMVILVIMTILIITMIISAGVQVIAAEGEHKASRALRHAAEVIADSPAALQVTSTIMVAMMLVVMVMIVMKVLAMICGFAGDDSAIWVLGSHRDILINVINCTKSLGSYCFIFWSFINIWGILSIFGVFHQCLEFD